ncbi:hypothetical protein PVT01_070030900 [Plasmodium vivax]|uniref:Uncharacterized protein n=1 Tax=Plasmodium vivax TaxID=5855 RepID=A0A1G4GVH2_PLAVI|nr:hypothetical protein PVT01_070030900 [Plasmodium vivax]
MGIQKGKREQGDRACPASLRGVRAAVGKHASTEAHRRKHIDGSTSAEAHQLKHINGSTSAETNQPKRINRNESAGAHPQLLQTGKIKNKANEGSGGTSCGRKLNNGWKNTMR